jgi:hypothetical protein
MDQSWRVMARFSLAKLFWETAVVGWAAEKQYISLRALYGNCF